MSNFYFDNAEKKLRLVDYLLNEMSDKELDRLMARELQKIRLIPLDMFAAKEAIFKAIGNDPALNWRDLKITNDSYGKPVVEYKKDGFNHKILLSLSHSKKYAVANAIITTE